MPLGEEIERYRVVLVDGGSAGAVRVEETSVPRLVLGPAAQVESFGALPMRLTARVSQFGLGVGPGTERQAVFDRPA